jgi:hypothetical protein
LQEERDKKKRKQDRQIKIAEKVEAEKVRQQGKPAYKSEQSRVSLSKEQLQ